MSGLLDAPADSKAAPAGGLVIGVDEAGLGPNLGPLVIGLTLWRTAGDPHDADPLRDLPTILSPTPAPGRVCVADSKALYGPGRGLGELARSARVAAAVCGHAPATAGQWLAALGSPPPDPAAQPWFADLAAPLPAADGIADLAAAWRTAGVAAGLELVAVRADAVFAPRFNALLPARGKGGLLTAASLGLLAAAWDPGTDPPARVECDKHGGRNFYAASLADAFGELPAVIREGPGGSEYALAGGRGRVAFRPRGEAFGPVALASLVAKFTREVFMQRFNEWWAGRAPGLKPTAGYPTDARRFADDTAAARRSLGIGEEAFWRAK